MLFWSSDFHYSVFQIAMSSSVSPNLLLIPASVFFISGIEFFSSNWVFFYIFQFFIKILTVFTYSFTQFS